MREFHPNAIRFENESVHDWAVGELRSVAARHHGLTRPTVYGYAFEFAALSPDDRPDHFEDFVMLRLNNKQFGDSQ